MKLIVTPIWALLLVAAQALPAAATVNSAMYCWVPDFEVAVACDDEDEAGGEEEALRPPLPEGGGPVRWPVRPAR
jgi:hypothetical protein